VILHQHQQTALILEINTDQEETTHRYRTSCITHGGRQ